MTTATKRVDSVQPFGFGAVAATMKLDLAAGLIPYRFWLMARNASGVGVAVTAIPNLIPVGAAELDGVTAGAADLDAAVTVRGQWFTGYANSALTAGDTFADTDFGKACYGVDNQTIGKLSNYSGANRSAIGVFLGLVNSTTGAVDTRFWGGVAGWYAARTAMMADGANGGMLVKVIDAGATTDTVNGYAEANVPRPKLHGTLTAVEFTVEGATLAASGATNFATFTLYKRDGAGGAAVSVATLTTKTIAFTQWTTVSFTLSAVAGAVDLLETDLLTLVRTTGASGAIVPAGTVRAILKVG
jgi:hypothetical protein